jgi:hypothetical protein
VPGFVVALHRTAFADPRLPELTERFAADRLTALTPADNTPAVLFVCVHNAGRSQMAAGWLRHLAGDRAPSTEPERWAAALTEPHNYACA